MVPLVIIYRSSQWNMRSSEITIASLLLFFSLQIAQAILVSSDLRGSLGSGFVDFLAPFIGLFGVWIFWLIATSVSGIILLDKGVDELLLPLKNFIKNSTLKKEQTQMNSIEKPMNTYEEVSHYEQIEAPCVTEDDFDTPSFDRHNVQTSIDEVQPTLDELDAKPVKIKLIKKETLTDSTEVVAAVKNPTSHSSTILQVAQEVKEKKHAVVVDELEENTKLLASIEKGKVEKPKNFKLPSVDFLQKPKAATKSMDESELDDKIRYLIEKLAHFKIDGDVVRTYAGPVVSTFEFKPAANVKVSKILNLQDDLAMALSAETIRIQAPIPGKDVVGIEIPNESVDTIYLREILDDKLFKDSSSPLTIALGKDIVGNPFVTDLKKLPHLLIAGTTGSGKSVGINAMILSLLYKNSPDQLRLLMIDPKMLEFSTYNDIPHLLTPVITKPKQAIAALNNMVNEMERRYELMADARTKNIENYNEKVKKEGGEHFPYIVVIIDELADLMMTSGKDVEYSIARLAQKSRACGIHLIVATQRPSVDVVTGLIKANLPSRLSYRVGQKIDSKIILDQMGAESLLGRGDMLFTPPGSTGLVRLHAPWATEEEIEEIVEFIKAQREPNYDRSFLFDESEVNKGSSSNKGISEGPLDELYEDAKMIIINDKKTSISYLQRRLQIGYNRSATIIEQLQNQGILSEPNAKGNREIVGG